MPTYYTKNGKKIMYPNAYAKTGAPMYTYGTKYNIRCCIIFDCGCCKHSLFATSDKLYRRRGSNDECLLHTHT